MLCSPLPRNTMQLQLLARSPSFLLLLLSVISPAGAFLVNKRDSLCRTKRSQCLLPPLTTTPQHHLELWAQTNGNSKSEIDDSVTGNDLLALSSETSNDDERNGTSTVSVRLIDDIGNDAQQSNSVATMMMSQSNKRVLIEELSYKRGDVERLRFELVPLLVERRVKCPPAGVPSKWCRSKDEIASDNAMLKKLEQESKYPLKVPLLGISLVLFGKGFGDAFITLIKVNTDFPGASFAGEFMGFPVLLIDAVCVVAGVTLGWWTWTWTNMR